MNLYFIIYNIIYVFAKYSFVHVSHITYLVYKHFFGNYGYIKPLKKFCCPHPLQGQESQV